MSVIILYRDIRTYGEREYLYKEARAAGVIFMRFSPDTKPEVVLEDGKLLVKTHDPILGRPVEIETDLLNLATAIIPNKDEQLANFFKVPLNDDGFFCRTACQTRAIRICNRRRFSLRSGPLSQTD